MDTASLLTYRKFADRQEALTLAELLDTHGIIWQIEDQSPAFDPFFTYTQTNAEFRLKIRPEDFEQADRIQTAMAEALVEQIPRSHYLYSFDDDQLLEIVEKSDEWSKTDYLLARKLLKERGREVNQEEVAKLREKRIQELATPEKSNQNWIIAGYIFAFLGGLLGLFMGIALMNHQKTLPNGKRVYGFSESDRIHGKRIMVISLIFILAWTVIRLIYQD